MFKQPFSFDGRIRRTEYCLSFGIYIAALFAISLLAESENTALIALLFYVPFIWFMLAQGAKRCHDRGRSGWWQLLPFYGFLLMFFEGYPGENEYGPDPKGRRDAEDVPTVE